MKFKNITVFLVTGNKLSEACRLIEHGELISIDLDQGLLHYAHGEIPFQPIPASVRKIFDAGGLIEYTRARLSSTRN